jgi:hypothetical protein
MYELPSLPQHAPSYVAVMLNMAVAVDGFSFTPPPQFSFFTAKSS